MAVSTMKAVFKCDIQKVWDVVTSLTHYAWRTDLDRIEIVDENQFVEYTVDGYKTIFRITAMEECKRWEFDLENEHMKGHWTGIFSQDEEGTTIEFTESVTAKKFYMVPFVKGYMKQQQALYVSNLRVALQV